MHFGHGTATLVPERAKLYLKFLRLRAGCATAALGCLGGKDGRMSDLQINCAMAYQVRQGEFLRL